MPEELYNIPTVSSGHTSDKQPIHYVIKKALQGEPRNAAVNFYTYWSLQLHSAVLTAKAHRKI